MKKLRNVFQGRGFDVFLFILGLVIFNYPFLMMQDVTQQPRFMFFYLFVSWVIIIFFIFLLSRSYTLPSDQVKEGPDKQKESPHF